MPSLNIFIRAAVVLLLASWLAACGGGGDNTGTCVLTNSESCGKSNTTSP